MPHPAQLPPVALLLVIVVSPVFGKQPTSSPPCENRLLLLEQINDALANSRRDEALRIIQDARFHCESIRVGLETTAIGIEFQDASEAIMKHDDERARTILQGMAYHDKEAVGPLAELTSAALLSRNQKAPDWNGAWKYSLIGLFLVALLAYIMGVIPARKSIRLHEKLFWFLPPIISRRQQTPLGIMWAAVLGSSITIFISWLVLYWLDPRHSVNVFASPGVLFAVLVSLATFWSLGNTLVISTRQRSEFVKFSQFYREIERILVDLRSRDKEATAEDAYIIDYSANVGQVSDRETAKRIAWIIGQFRSRKGCTTHLLVLPMDDLEKVYEPLLRRQGYEGSQLDSYMNDLKDEVQQTYAKIDQEQLAIWRSRKIYSEHYLVSANEGLQYIVIPRENGKKNDLMGETTYDVNRIEFLRHTALDYLKEAITPSYVTADSRYPSFGVRQHGIDRIDVFYGNHEKDLERFESFKGKQEDYDKLESEGGYQKIPINGTVEKKKEYAIESPSFELAKVRLVKKHGVFSPLSHTIRLRKQNGACSGENNRGEGRTNP